MKKSLLSLLIIFSSFQMFGQLNIRIGVHDPVKNNSGWNVPMNNFASVAEGRAIIAEILDAVDRNANFEIQSTTRVPNAAAVNSGGRRYVLYNPNFINQLDRASGNRWASISVLAHEVGHHLEGHTDGGQGSNPSVELEADEFSGYALRKMGATLADAQAAMQLIASNYESVTHPGKHNRLTAIKNGWNVAHREEGGVMARDEEPVRRQKNGQTSPGTDTRRQTASVSLGEILIGILGQVFSGTVRNGGFVVNNQSNVLQRVNNQWHHIGNLSRTNNSRYPFIISGNRNGQMYVDKKGNIINRAGQVLGLLQAMK